VWEQIAVFVAGFMTAITGFGFNALSVPILTLVFEPHHAIVVGLLVGLLVFLVLFLLPGVRQAVDARLVWILFAWSIPALPAGAWLLVWLDERALRLTIGGLTFLYATAQLFGLIPTVRASRRAAPYVGLLSGLLSSSVSLGGTPVMLYLIGFGGEPRDLRATAVAYVILSTVGSLVVLSWTGLVDRAALVDAGVLAPASLIGLGVGALAFRYFDRRLFVRVTLVMLSAVGLFALVAGLR
jgi:uncharacterized protein